MMEFADPSVTLLINTCARHGLSESHPPSLIAEFYAKSNLGDTKGTGTRDYTLQDENVIRN